MTTPSSILIVGSGVFGLSTAYALTQRPQYAHTKITVLDRSPFHLTTPASPDASSIDTSRIIRADYSLPSYADLASAAQSLWRSSPHLPNGGFGAQGRYSESALLLVANSGAQGEAYVRSSYANVQALSHLAQDPEGISPILSRAEIEREARSGGQSGDWGYVNRRSGWADASASMVYLRGLVEGTGRVEFRRGEVRSLRCAGSPAGAEERVTGVWLVNGDSVQADVTILATGAWTGRLVDLRGRATATGQVLSYLALSPTEQSQLENMPVLLNMSTGMFIIPPRANELKIARHSYGYLNPVSIPLPRPSPTNPSLTKTPPSSPGGLTNGESRHEKGEHGETITVSLPRTSWDDPTQRIPAEGETACRQALREMIPSLSERAFTKTRICWYSDTPDGDFLVDYHPQHKGLFLATGGSGHGFKFLPVIGDKIVDVLSWPLTGGKLDVLGEELRRRWAWRETPVECVVTEDGSRGGRPGLVLMEELGR